MFGLLNIRKPPGPTSHDIVDLVRRRLRRGEKVGHAGTLDPFAEGVLVVCVGPATRLADYVQARPKRYLAQVTLGATSTTDDPTGVVTASPPAVAPSEDDVREVLVRFIGQLQQTPPAHSAVHVAGRRAYELARAGEDFQLPARTVAVHGIELLSYEFPLLELEVVCGSGTYVRSIARDIGSALRCGGYCGRLTRTAVGPFTIDQAVETDRLDPARDLLSPLLAVEHLPQVAVTAAVGERLANGHPVMLTPSQLDVRARAAPARSEELAVVDKQGRLLAIGSLGQDGATLRPVKVFLA